VLFITHDLAVAAGRADRIAVMQGGRIVECGPARQVVEQPRHACTGQLVTAARRTLGTGPTHGRTRRGTPLLAVDALVKEYGARRRAVDGVSFTVDDGEIFGLVGESGSGKSTTARLVTGLERPSSGSVRFAERSGVRPQLVQQSPHAALDPRWSVRRSVEEPLRTQGFGDRCARRARVAELFEQVALSPSLLDRRPAELSGGQRQRVVIARALAPGSDLLVCDEPVSALDVSAQGRILELLAGLRARLGLAVLLISHDLGVVRELCDRVAVMRVGRLVEEGPARQVLVAPEHPYTRELIDAATMLGEGQPLVS
jgi:peptide/nickel transport system ATP-binding protein